jgi:D-glycero-D-manno-heptose 1,7-bisphosphate phosphatase
MQPAVFLDRDGVIIENRPHYVRSWDEVSILPGALPAIARAARAGYAIVIVTNQAGVGKGLIPLPVAEEINRRLVMEIERAGGKIAGVYLCPHGPAEGCACRKPLPGLLVQAARELSLDLARSVLVGDAVSDLQAGRAAGVREVCLVRTGRGAGQELAPEFLTLQPVPVADNLAEALTRLLGLEPGDPPD